MTELLIVLICIAVNAALAALEVAFVSASEADLTARAAPNDPRVRRVLRLREVPERTLSAVLGRHEGLPPSACFEPSAAAPGIYRRVS